MRVPRVEFLLLHVKEIIVKVEIQSLEAICLHVEFHAILSLCCSIPMNYLAYFDFLPFRTEVCIPGPSPTPLSQTLDVRFRNKTLTGARSQPRSLPSTDGAFCKT